MRPVVPSTLSFPTDGRDARHEAERRPEPEPEAVPCFEVLATDRLASFRRQSLPAVRRLMTRSQDERNKKGAASSGKSTARAAPVAIAVETQVPMAMSAAVVTDGRDIRHPSGEARVHAQCSVLSAHLTSALLAVDTSTSDTR